MCGITGYTGRDAALPYLLQGLEKLEYRGYDSAGVTLVNHKGLLTYKAKGRLEELEKTIDYDRCTMNTGIGHTRWATHGIPSNLNAHPHNNEDNTISIVHNGIIENWESLRKMLTEAGQHFASDTDSEVIVQLLDYHYKQNHDLEKAFFTTIRELEGSFGLCAVATFDPNTVYVAKMSSPMVLGKTKDSSFCGSDPTALLAYTKDVLPMDDGQVAILKKDGITLYDFDGNELPQHWMHIPYDVEAAQKGGYDSFMLKEIHEQPYAIQETLRGRFDRQNHVIMKEIAGLPISWTEVQRIYLIACGTAYHACVYAGKQLEACSEVECLAVPASEFRYGHPVLNEHVLCIYVSQSGETADTLSALRIAKEKGAHTIAITNVLGSSISRLAEATLYTSAGPEIAVASTKAYTTQLTLLTLLILKLSELMHFEIPQKQKLIKDLRHLPALAEEMLKCEEQMKHYAELMKDQHDVYFIGRQLDYPTALEGALKLKEVSYIHADAYYAGELKHGPIALIEKDTVVVAVATQENVAAKTMSNIEETIARGARIILITASDIPAEKFPEIVRLPAVSPALCGILAVIPLQFLAYYAAVLKGCDVDKPRNLAKSVTVE